VSVVVTLDFMKNSCKKQDSLSAVMINFIKDENSEHCEDSCFFAKFPKDNSSVIPENCKDIILFSAYPHGYLDSLVERYRKNGGNRL